MSDSRRDPGRTVFGAVVAAVYLFLLLPIAIVVIASLNAGEYLKFPPDGLSLRWYWSFFRSQPFMDAFQLSLRVAVTSSVCATLIGTAAALYYVRFAGRWREGFRFTVLGPLLLPEILSAIALLFFFYQVGVGTRSPAALQLGHVLITTPFVFLAVCSALYNLNPSLEEAARSLGASPATTFRRVTLPLIKPGVITGAMFAFIISFDLFNMSLLLKGIGSTTLPIQLFDYLRWDFDPTAAAVSTVSIVMTLTVVLVTDRLVGLRAIRF
jgi:putative spermidine/putrescine transport system permease protein